MAQNCKRWMRAAAKSTCSMLDRYTSIPIVSYGTHNFNFGLPFTRVSYHRIRPRYSPQTQTHTNSCWPKANTHNKHEPEPTTDEQRSVEKCAKEPQKQEIDAVLLLHIDDNMSCHPSKHRIDPIYFYIFQLTMRTESESVCVWCVRGYYMSHVVSLSEFYFWRSVNCHHQCDAVAFSEQEVFNQWKYAVDIWACHGYVTRSAIDPVVWLRFPSRIDSIAFQRFQHSHNCVTITHTRKTRCMNLPKIVTK